ncbi:methionyl-tRNA formyltransferase [Corynebacterium sp. TAE3-ERU12]|uniref:methionyl-tRNA formyltransferase n=1 Tax=Corynebacterium sp. TAE3-ERU12 TaxID=2849491 RepID=UPI001C48810A|nr:methionyl-tRNA formyltransferase [Corynebacterium sp. TAE3-ERU12]MBV7295396.1 methionyl-tRNA formyltransferase [Corynebacterium sp. TAE3-ERU12]
MRIVFAGTPEAAVPSLRALLAAQHHDIVGVLTRPDARVGRGRKLRPSPVREVAAEAGVEVLTPSSLRGEASEQTRHRLQELAPDCIAVVAYGQLVPPDLLDLPTHGWVNLHFSLLPAYRGAAPVQAAIARGDDITGASTFRIEEGLDTGPVFGRVTETIRNSDTSGDLLERLAVSGADLLVATMDGLDSGALRPEAQPDVDVSYAAKITTEDARVDWSLPAHVIDRQVRAHSPAPGAWTMLGADRLKLGPVRLVDGGEDLPAGQIRVQKRTVLVGTGSGPVELSQVQVPGKKMMAAGDWANGAQPDGKALS